ncbi:unnamed protein product, partial [Phaeothamnion confervicola]
LAIHDTAQVVGAALTYREVFGDEIALQAATVTKLTRNLFLAVVTPALAWMHARDDIATTATAAAADAIKAAAAAGIAAPRAAAGAGTASAAGTPAAAHVPPFVLGFLVASALRSVGDATLDGGGAAFGLLLVEEWHALTSLVGNTIGSHYLLGTAMAAVGLGTSASVLRGVGPRPFAVGLAGAGTVGLTGLASALLLGAFI